MPFVLICGLPSSGKTTRCKQLKKLLEDQENAQVHTFGDHDLNVVKNEVYAGPVL